MRTLRKKPTPGVFDYAGSHSAKRNLRDSARSRAFDNVTKLDPDRGDVCGGGGERNPGHETKQELDLF